MGTEFKRSVSGCKIKKLSPGENRFSGASQSAIFSFQPDQAERELR
jgi:hypothetical protein